MFDDGGLCYTIFALGLWLWTGIDVQSIGTREPALEHLPSIKLP